MTTYIFLPPVRTPTGGITVLCQLASRLRELGHAVAFVQREQSGEGWAPHTLDAHIPLVPWNDAHPSSTDTWLVPEGWVNALSPGLSAGARCVVYVQNWAYLHTALPPEVRWQQLDVSFIAVSEPVRAFVQQTTGRNASIVRPAIDTELFAPRPLSLAPGQPPRVAYMPRKNKHLADQITHIVPAQQAEFVPVAGLDARGVAKTLAACHLFLATGFPEGCPLPPLEAMACATPVVGFAGFGGYDYMRAAADFPGAYAGWLPLRPVDWQSNGLYCADGDVAACLHALEAATALYADPARLDSVLADCQATANAYNTDAQREEVAHLVRAWVQAT